MKVPRSLIRILYPLSLAGILLASFSPVVPQPPPGVEYLDKIEHGFAYAVAGALGAFFFRRPGRRNSRAALRSIVFGMTLGIAIELVQPFVGRSRELIDGLADFCGLLAGAGFFLAVSKPRERTGMTPISR